MKNLLLAAFSQPVEPINQWLILLKSLGIEAVFLNPQDCQPQLLSRLSKNKIKVFLEFGFFPHEPLLWRKLPQARVVGRSGKVLTNFTFNRKPVCPNHPQIRKMKLNQLNQISQKFAFDGVWLDGFRFPSTWERKTPEKIETCFCPHCRALFGQHLGIKPPQGSQPDWPLRLYSQEWYRWRAQQLVGLLKEVKLVIKRNQPKTKLGIFVVPLTKKEFGNAIIKIFAQDVAALAKEVDFVSPMLYHRMCSRKLSWIKKRVGYFSKLTGAPILPAIQTSDLPETLPNRMTAEELQTALNLALSPPSKGVILFTIDNLLPLLKIDIIKRVIDSALR